MKLINNELIKDAIVDFTSGEGHSTRPFSKVITDEYDNVIDKNSCYITDDNEVFYRTDYNDVAKYTRLMTTAELKQNIIEQFNYAVKRNNPADMLSKDVEAYKLAIEL